MPFVKLDTGILDSTTWFDKDARDIFITALLMAKPREFEDDLPQIEVTSLDHTGWMVPAGWYGFIEAAGTGIVNRCGLQMEKGLEALERLGSPEAESRSQEHDGRRLVRVNGGYLVLNYIRYREKDHTAAERQRRHRARKRHGVTLRDSNVTLRDVTQAEAEAEERPSEATAYAAEAATIPLEVEVVEDVSSSKEPALPETVAQEGEKKTKKQEIDLVIGEYKKHHPRSRPGKKERNLIAARLKDGYSVVDLAQAIHGNHNDPFCCGVNDDGRKYHKLELIMRDSSHVDQYMLAWDGKDDPILTASTKRAMMAAQRVASEGYVSVFDEPKEEGDEQRQIADERDDISDAEVIR